jgi:3',5'-cyclic AMP phosphodiesterase CpdA
LAMLCAPCRPAAADHYRFIVYGDTRSDDAVHRDVVAKIISLHPEFVLQTGDLVDNGQDAVQWRGFDAITKPLRNAHIAYYPARGNHDMGVYYQREVREPFDSGNPYYYAFTRHGARFIVIDSMDPNEFDPSSDQYRWLIRELTTAHRSEHPFYVMFHESPISVGPHGPTPDAKKYLMPLFVKYRPTAVFCGHDHLYYRTRRDGIYYFVSGGGGAPLYPPINSGLAIPGDVYASVHHVIVFDVDGARVTATAIPVDAGRGATVADVTAAGVESKAVGTAPIDQVIIESNAGK